MDENKSIKEMDSWLVLGLMAAVSYGLAGLCTKIALGEEHMGLTVTVASLFTVIGVVIPLLIFYVKNEGLKMPQVPAKAVLPAILIGFFWALGQILVYTAILKKADISRMAPIYNMNTLIVVFGGIILLKELPDKSQAIRVVIGSIFIVIGAIFVSI